MGCGSQYVRESLAALVEQCRSIVGRRTGCLLVVMTDADATTVIDRKRELANALAMASLRAIAEDEPIILFVPKWQVETWIKSAIGQDMSKDDQDSDRPPVSPQDIRDAATAIFEWARRNAVIGRMAVPSLVASLPDWRRMDRNA
jgi:hypothetical protein